MYICCNWTKNMNGQMDVWMDKWVYEWTNGCMNGQMDVWMDEEQYNILIDIPTTSSLPSTSPADNKSLAIASALSTSHMHITWPSHDWITYQFRVQTQT